VRCPATGGIIGAIYDSEFCSGMTDSTERCASRLIPGGVPGAGAGSGVLVAMVVCGCWTNNEIELLGKAAG
jgi:hypothetical protein